jgi:hypothetical protein
MAGEDLEGYVANPLNALGVMKRTGFDYFYDLKPVVDNHFEESEGLARIKNLSSIFPDSYAYADACSSIALLQVCMYNVCMQVWKPIWSRF